MSEKNPFIVSADEELKKQNESEAVKVPQGVKQSGLRVRSADELKVNPHEDVEQGFDFSLAEGTANVNAPEQDFRKNYQAMIASGLQQEQPINDEDLAKMKQEHDKRKRQVNAVDAVGALGDVAAAFANYAYSGSPTITIKERKPTDTSKLDKEYARQQKINADQRKKNEQIRAKNEKILQKEMQNFDKIADKTKSAGKVFVKPNYKAANINGQHYTYDANTFTDETVLSLYDKFFGTPTDYKPTPAEKKEMLLRYSQLPEYGEMRKTLESNGVTFTEYYKEDEPTKVTMSAEDKKKYAKDKPYTPKTYDNTRHAQVNDVKYDYDPNQVPDDTWYDLYGTWYGEKPTKNMTEARNRLFNDAVEDENLRRYLSDHGVKITDIITNRIHNGSKK